MPRVDAVPNVVICENERGRTSIDVETLRASGGGRVVRGMADVCLAAIGVATTTTAVAAHYGARADGGLLDAWLVAEEDAASTSSIAGLGIRSVVAPLWMRDEAHSSALAEAALSSAGR